MRQADLLGREAGALAGEDDPAAVGGEVGMVVPPPPPTSLCRPVPSGWVSQTSKSPPRSLAKAIHSPVGDQSHIVSVHLPSVSRRTCDAVGAP